MEGPLESERHQEQGNRHPRNKNRSSRRPPLERKQSLTNKKPSEDSQPKDDENLPKDLKNPRGKDPNQRITKKASSRGVGRNTESFDPSSTLVRPDLRVKVGSAAISKFNKPLKHDDVVIVPELFGKEEDWSLYYQLVDEITELQQKETKGSEWIPWHEGAHLIVKKPEESPTFQKILDRLCEYFNIRKKSIGYRFNWYKDSTDWKPFHHDSA